MADPLAGLVDLPGVAEQVDRARKAVDDLLWPRNLGELGPQLAVESRVYGAQACAAIDGVDFALTAWRSGDAWEDSPMGRTAAGVWRGYRELRSLVDTWNAAPLQALARLHALVAADLEPEDELGRPRNDEPTDPLRIGLVPEPEVAANRLGLLARLVGTGSTAPAVVTAAVVHGEILSLQPFTHGSGIIARMATRLELAARGLDPDMLSVPEAGVATLGRPAYVDAIRRYQSGTPEGVAAWIRFQAEAVVVGSGVAREILSEIRAIPLGKDALNGVEKNQ